MDQDKLLSSIKIDPNNILTPSQKKGFKDLILRYKDVFNKQPGQYNGSFGEVNNSISFTKIPPPNDKVYFPQYSEAMKIKMAEKMDKLEREGVLCCPEELGVSIEYVNPSLLTYSYLKGQSSLVGRSTALAGVHRFTPRLPWGKLQDPRHNFDLRTRRRPSRRQSPLPTTLLRSTPVLV